jgi:[ribosomal protein S18]-alanine N-acetyltransferase
VPPNIPPALIIRLFRPDDLADVLRIEQLCFGADAWPEIDFLNLVEDEGGLFLIGERSTELLAYVIGWLIEGEGYIANLAVHPGVRGQQIGRSMVERIIAELTSRGADDLALHVNENNLAAIRLYESFGFRTVDKMRDYYEDGSTGLLMWRPI